MSGSREADPLGYRNGVSVTVICAWLRYRGSAQSGSASSHVHIDQKERNGVEYLNFCLISFLSAGVFKATAERPLNQLITRNE